MSSHHIVRENQEPALLVASSDAINDEGLGQLLEWSPTILTDIENVDHLLALEIKVDIVFGKAPIQGLQEATKIVPLDNSADFLDSGLHYLIANNFKAVNILTDSIPILINRYAEKINIVLFCQRRRYVFVRHQFEKWMPKGDKMYIDESTLKSFQGLDYVHTGVFETTADGFVTLEFSTDSYVLVGEDMF